MTGRRKSYSNSIRYVLFFFFALPLLLQISCSSSFTRYKPLEETMHLILFSLPEDKYPRKKEIRDTLPPMAVFPEMTSEQLESVFRSLHFEKSALWGRSVRHAFYEEEIRYITPFILDNLKKLPVKERLVVVSRHDPDKSVLSRMDRITFLIWNDEAGINLLFGEIREEIPVNDPFTEDDWKNIFPINPERPYPDLRIVPADEKEPLFSFKEVLGRKHLTWVVIDRNLVDTIAGKFPSPEKMNELRQSEMTREADLKKASESRAAPRTLVDRLRELQEALDAKLITPEEYDSRRKQILDAH